MNDTIFQSLDFGQLKPYLENDDVTDISYSNNGQLWVKTLSKGLYRVEDHQINNAFMEKLAFQCSNVMGKTFNPAHPFLDAESTELRLNFVHDSIARNGIAVVLRKTPAKIRLEKEKILNDKYITLDIHDFLEKCVLGHCNIIVCGETGSGKTEFVKYLASKTRENEKLITIEDTLELHLDRIFPHRDIVAMKTNNIASYTDVLVTCMRQNPKWILLSEVRSAEAVMAVRNSISSGHYILSTIHADKAASIPNRMYSLLETNQDIDQFLKSIYRYIQLGVLVRGYQDKETKKFVREIGEVTEFYVTKDNEAVYNTIYKKGIDGTVVRNQPSSYLIDYIESQGIEIEKNVQEIMREKEKEQNKIGEESIPTEMTNFIDTPKQEPVFNTNSFEEVKNIPLETKENESSINNFYMEPTQKIVESYLQENKEIEQNLGTIDTKQEIKEEVESLPHKEETKNEEFPRLSIPEFKFDFENGKFIMDENE